MLDIPSELLYADHALFAPSSAYRWLECPASIGRSIGVEPRETTWQAEQGTAAHWVLEQCIDQGCPAIEFDGCTAPNDWKIDYEICIHVQWALNWLYHNCNGLILSESKSHIYKQLSLPTPDPVVYGTTDIQVLGEGDTFWLLDFKYGAWNEMPKGNPQLELYAIGALDIIEGYDRVILGVLQPRKGGAKLAEYTPQQLRDLKPKYEKAIAAALEDDALAKPSYGACMFCDAQLVCKDYRGNTEKDLDEMFDLYVHAC